MKNILALSTLCWLALTTTHTAALAYPDFIGYGYSSCITCHYNGHGSGALNDYGRALYATEISARDVYPKNMDEEEVAAKSGFLGSKPLPWWIRPGLKYRGLWFQNSPTSPNSAEKWINMQNDVNLTGFFDKKQRLTFVSTASYTSENTVRGEKYAWFAKEYYLRWKQNNNFWVYLGQLDKTYGLRLIDHTAVSRRAITLGQFDQSQGVVTHWTYPDWDVAVNAFFGNGDEEAEEKQKGFAVTGEYQVMENVKVGGSALSSQSDQSKWNLLAAIARIGLSKGSSIIAEAGLKEKTNKQVADSDAVLGSYAVVQTMVNVRRGYNILSVIEHSREDLSKSSNEVMKWALGGLLFPLPRTEVRASVVNMKTFSPSGGTPDFWQLQTQLHLSF